MSSGNEDNGAFQLLFNYISGENTSSSNVSMTSPVEVGKRSQEIAMTSPVEVSSSETMMFFLPSKYDIKSAPVPTHKDVSLVTVPARTVAAIRYSGFNKDSDKKQYTNKLLKALRDNKRHEIIVPVDILKSSTNWCEIKTAAFKATVFWGHSAH